MFDIRPVPTRISKDDIGELPTRYVNPKHYIVNKISKYEKEFEEAFPQASPTFNEWLTEALSYWRYSYGFGIDKLADRYRAFASGQVPNADWRSDIRTYLGVPTCSANPSKIAPDKNDILSLMSPASYQSWSDYEQSKQAN